ncbi:MAG: hypothetical protein H6742_19115 [Alphaproteobacteria bacterium]|nr:hypothetical protein [Alphaproteobacteria bacterium]
MNVLLLPLVLSRLTLAGPAPAAMAAEGADDPLPWEQASRALLDGPDTCIQLRGEVRYAVALYTPGGWLGRAQRRDLTQQGVLEGTLDHGFWTSLQATWPEAEEGAEEGDEDVLEVARVRPIVGRRPKGELDGEEGEESEESEEGGSLSISLSGDDTKVAADQGAQALGMLDGIIEDIDPAVTTSWIAWDEASDAVVLRQQVPLQQGGELMVQTVFPDMGPPTSLDAVFPRRIAFREGPVRVVLRDAQLHLRGQQTSLGLVPVEESASAVVGVFGFTLGFEQRISYTGARACP